MIKFEIILLFKNNKVLYTVRMCAAMKIIMFVAPRSISSTPCSLLLPPEGPVVFLQWSPSFTSQHAVEMYRVIVTPDPSSCSSQQVSPSEDYTCSGLVLGIDYSFTVSAINCGNQEGIRENFTLRPRGIKINDNGDKGVASYIFKDGVSSL